MNKAYIKAIAHYLPEETLDNERLSAMFPEWSVEKISSKTGIYKRHISAENEFSSDMAIKAAEKLFADNNIARADIDFILLCTQSPDYFLPTTAALDYNLGCSGYIYGLALAKGLIYAGIAKNVLLITSETYSKFVHPKDKSNRTIFGDAAAATLVATSGIAEILDFELGTDGRGAENLIVKEGGIKHPITTFAAEDVADEYGNINNDRYLYMNGSEIFNFTSEMVPVMVTAILQKHQLAIDDIGLFVFHQANRFMLNHLRKKLKITEEKFYLYLENCGNTVSSTIPIALEQAIAEQATKPGEQVLLAGFGVGYSWGATILKF